MDSLTPLHLILIALIVAVVLGPARAGRLLAKIVGGIQTYRRLSGSLTPSGVAEALYRVALPPGEADATGRDLPPT